MMIRKVLVPLDGSPTSEIVLPVVTSLASKAGYELTLFAVWETTAEEPWMLEKARLDELRQHGVAYMGAYLREVARELESRGIHAGIEVRSGHPAVEIASAAADLEMDLIAMATHGRRGATTARRGSVADKVLRESAVPVLAVGPMSLHGVEPQAIQVRRILVPLDGTADAESALPRAAEVARDLEAEISLIRVVRPLLQDYYGSAVPEWLQPGVERPRHEEAARYLSVIQDQYKDVTRTHVSPGLPAEEICNLAEREGIDLIVMASHSRGRAGTWTLGGVADEVIEGPVPVVIVPP
jgi:nucleotide-binding universal stress UspA family protein